MSVGKIKIVVSIEVEEIINFGDGTAMASIIETIDGVKQIRWIPFIVTPEGEYIYFKE